MSRAVTPACRRVGTLLWALPGTCTGAPGRTGTSGGALALVVLLVSSCCCCVRSVPTGPDSPGAGDLRTAPQDAAAYHRPAPDTRGDSLAAGNEPGGGERFPPPCPGSGGLFLSTCPHPALPGRPGSGGQSCRRLGLCSPTTKPRLGERRRSRAKSKALLSLGTVRWERAGTRLWCGSQPCPVHGYGQTVEEGRAALFLPGICSVLGSLLPKPALHSPRPPQHREVSLPGSPPLCRRYHRVLKKTQRRKALKEFELLHKSDPEAALARLEELEQLRMQVLLLRFSPTPREVPAHQGARSDASLFLFPPGADES